MSSAVQERSVFLQAISGKLDNYGYTIPGTTSLVSLNDGNGEGIAVYSTVDIPGTVRVVFTGEDRCWIEYRRDHHPVHILPCNKPINKDPIDYMYLFEYNDHPNRRENWVRYPKDAVLQIPEDSIIILHGIKRGQTEDFSPLAHHLANDAKIPNGVREAINNIYFLQYPTEVTTEWRAPGADPGVQFNYAPDQVGDAIARKLKSITLDPNTGQYHRINVIAHSQGGVLARWAIEQCGASVCVNHFATLCSPHGGIPQPEPFTLQDTIFFKTFLQVVNCEPAETSGLYETSAFIKTMNLNQQHVPCKYLTIGGTDADTYWMTAALRGWLNGIYGDNENYDGFVGTQQAMVALGARFPGRNRGMTFPCIANELENPRLFMTGSVQVNHGTVKDDERVFRLIDIFLANVK